MNTEKYILNMYKKELLKVSKKREKINNIIFGKNPITEILELRIEAREIYSK